MRWSAVACAALCALLVGCASGSVLGGQSSGGGSCHVRGSGTFVLPDPACTPGATSSAVTQRNIGQTICRRGYTKTVRPPASITGREKRVSMAAYGDTGSPRDYEYDHLIPLELGGAPNSARNLWPEPGATPNPKDKLEGRLRSAVWSGALTLAVAQHLIATDWVRAWRRFVQS